MSLRIASEKDVALLKNEQPVAKSYYKCVTKQEILNQGLIITNNMYQDNLLVPANLIELPNTDYYGTLEVNILGLDLLVRRSGTNWLYTVNWAFREPGGTTNAYFRDSRYEFTQLWSSEVPYRGICGDNFELYILGYNSSTREDENFSDLILYLEIPIYIGNSFYSNPDPIYVSPVYIDDGEGWEGRLFDLSGNNYIMEGSFFRAVLLHPSCENDTLTVTIDLLGVFN